MTDFITRIMEGKHAEVAQQKSRVAVEQMRERALAARRGARRHAFSAALRNGERVRVIAEIKRRSPSAGGLRAGVEPGTLAAGLAGAGAAGLSVLTDGAHFGGSLDDLRAARAAVEVPILRKDFTVDVWQVYEAAAAGADAVLLIMAGLDDEALNQLRLVAEDELGMDALVEVHTEEEMRRAGACGAGLVGVNNRDLRTLTTSVETSLRLIAGAPPGACLVSESGLRTGADLRRLRQAGYHGFLIGEALMRASDPARALAQMLAQAEA